MTLPFATAVSHFASAAMPILLEAGAKSLLILALASLVVLLLRRASAARRHLVWFGAVSSVALLPLLVGLLPGWHILSRWPLSSENRSSWETVRLEVPSIAAPREIAPLQPQP